jgi:hypothetical protein
VGLTAAFAVGLAFLSDVRRTGAVFAGFFLLVLAFLTVVVFLRVAALERGFSCPLLCSCFCPSFLLPFTASELE